MLKREKQIRVWQCLKLNTNSQNFSLLQFMSLSEFTVNFVCIFQNGAGFFLPESFSNQYWVEKWEHACESEKLGYRYLIFNEGVNRCQFLCSGIWKNQPFYLRHEKILILFYSFFFKLVFAFIFRWRGRGGNCPLPPSFRKLLTPLRC